MILQQMRRLSFGYQIRTGTEAQPRPPNVNYSRKNKVPVTWIWKQYFVPPYLFMEWHLRCLLHLQDKRILNI